MFRTSKDYHDLNAGAHRNSPKNLYAPALTWHLAFWINNAYSDQQQNLGQIDDVGKKLDTFLLTLCRALDADKKCEISNVRLYPRVRNNCGEINSILFKTIADINFIKINKPTLTDRQKDIFESSSRAVAVEFEWHEICLSIRCEMHTEYFSITTFAQFRKGRDQPFSTCGKLNEKIADALGYFKGDRDKKGIAPDLNEYFFRGFWASYSRHIATYPDVMSFCKDSIFDEIFADFRGIVLSEKAVKIQDNNEFFEDNQPPLWGVDAKEKFLPLLNAYNIARLRQYECAINYVLDGRAIYMSALAPQLPDAPDNERIPAEFILYAHQHVPDSAKKVSVNVWELGRLVNQLHILGTVRLAAMKHVKLLHAAGKRLSQLEPTMQKARESVALNETDTMTFIKGAHEQFNSITAEFRKNASCSLAYRIERSGNYVARFRSNIKFLQITGLEGDQPYDQFVERRLGAEFDFIERLGRRYGRAASNITALDQNYLSMETNKIDDETNKIDSGIHKIQEWGEFALLAALAPYYITHLLERFVSDERIPITTIIVWYIFLAIAFFRKFDKKICYRNRNIYSGNVLSRVVLSGIVLSLVSLLIGVGWKLSFVRFSGEPSAQLDVQREVLNAQEELGAIQREQLDVQEELKETQREQLKVVEGVLDALNAEREKKKAEPHRHPQKHQKRSAQ